MKVADYPLDTSDGNETYLGLSSGQIVKRYPKPAGGGSGSTQALMETRTAATAATIDVAVKALRTAGFAAVGDNGHGLYERRSTHPYLLWASGQTYITDGPRYYRTAAGNLYMLAQAGPGATANPAPSHTTANQIVYGADGYGWMAVSLNPVYFNSVDDFLPNGSTDATNGGWWELVPDGGQYTIEQFGGQAGYVNSSNRGTDNWQPLEHAKALNVWSQGYTKFTPVVQFGVGQYWFSKIVEFTQPNWIRGLARGNDSIGDGEPTMAIFAQNCGFIVQAAGTGPGHTENNLTTTYAGSGNGACATIEGFGISQENVTAFAENAQAIHCRTRAQIRKVTIYGCAGHGIAITAGSSGGPGNANRTLIDNVQIQGTCWGHGLFILGSDANACSIINFYTHGAGVRKCGICDIASYNNTYSGIEVDGFGGNAVWYSGKVYAQSHHSPAIGETPAARSDQWYYMFDAAAATSNYPAWDSGTQYTHIDLQLPIYCANTNSLFIGGYQENTYFVKSVITAGGSMAIGGNMTWAENSPYLKVTPLNPGVKGQAIVSQTGVGGHRELDPGHPAYARHGGYIGAVVGSMFPNNLGENYAQNNEQLALICFYRQTDGKFYGAYDTNNDISFKWEGATPVVFGMSGPQTTRAFGPYKFYANDMALVNPNNASVVGVIGVRDAQPSGSGLYLRGARYYTSLPVTGGREGWLVSAGGAIADAAWAPGDIEGGSIRSTTSGRRYRNAVWGPATAGNEPSHTSGTQPTGDGLVWTFLANGAPTFLQFGSIA